MAEEMFSFAELREAVAPAKRRTVKATTILPLTVATPALSPGAFRDRS
jgi:hypothetical protein